MELFNNYLSSPCFQCIQTLISNPFDSIFFQNFFYTDFFLSQTWYPFTGPVLWHYIHVLGSVSAEINQRRNSVKIHHVHENLLTFRKKKLCIWLETEKQMHSNTFKLVLSDKYDLFTYIYISKCKFLRHFFHHLMIRWKLVVLSFFRLINN